MVNKISLVNRLFCFTITLIFFFMSLAPLSSSFAMNDKKLSFRAYNPKPSKAALDWANKELKRMTTDEKIGQLFSIGINATYLNQDSAEFQELKRQVVENKIGGIILFVGPVYESVHLVNRMQQLAKYPLLISADLEAGAGMRFLNTVNLPWNMAVAATGNPDFARRQGEITARESRALGIQQVYAPVVDVNNNAANPVINVRSYGEDPNDVARFGAAFIEGLQRGGVIATAKHFPGHGDTAIDSHRGLPIINVSRERLNQVELVPFKEAIKANVGSIMVAHISLPQIDPTEIKPLQDSIKPTDTDAEIKTESATVPSTLSPVVNTQILRKDLGFDGLIVTDAMSMSGLTLYVHQDEAAVRALLAGADMLLKPADTDLAIRGVKEAVKSGRVTIERVEQSVRKILAAKYDLGLVKQRVTPLEEIDKIVAGKDAEQLADEIATKAITLVRNDKNNLPLKADAKVFNLVFTNGDDRFWIARPFNDAFREAGKQIETFALDERSSQMEINMAIARAMKADVVIVSMYGRVRSGAANSVGLPRASEQALRSLFNRNEYKPIIGIAFGNPYALMNFPEFYTYFVAYGDMPSLQRAAARAVLNQQDITGRLPIALPNLHPRGTGIQLKAAK
jgi:beta-N-acetylhexosaminidase